jgi:hypothetical protein
VLAFALATALSASAQQTPSAPAQRSATVTCGTCHVGVLNSYAHAPMRHAMEPAGANPQLNAHPDLKAEIGGYNYSVQTKNGQSTYSVSDSTGTLTLPIHWVFGQHSQTFVLEKDGKLYESLVSYFPRENGLGTSPGDQLIKPTNLTEAMGRELSPWETLTCFNCHATYSTAGTRLTLDTLVPGINCERCHEGALRHMADAANDNFKTRPPSLKHMTTQDISMFCGQCHRTWETAVRNHWKGTAFVRFQPYRLQNSKCFAANDPRISCLACHSPHQPVNHDQAFYDRKCLACHAPDAKPVAPATVAAKACPVSKSNCSTCHMPKVELPGGHAQFTDHQIRIARTGDPYPN